MKKSKWIAAILIAGFFLCILITAGCEEEQSPGLKQSKLITEENMNLKKQIEKKDIEIAKLKKAIDTCETEKITIKKEMEKQVNAIGEETLKTFEDYVRVEEENRNLKKQIEELQKQPAELKKSS